MWTKGLLSFKNLAKTRNACCEQNIEYNCVVYLFNMLQACYYQKYCAAGISYFSVDTEGKLNVQKTFRKRPGRPLNVLCTFNLRPRKMMFKENKYYQQFSLWRNILPTSFSHYWDTMSLFWSIEFSFRRCSSVWYIRWRT